MPAFENWSSPRLLAGLKPWSIGVVIPARNEGSTIAACIASVLDAVHQADRRISVWIVVVADSCSDQTAAVAQRALGAFGEVISANVRSPGAARKLGTNAVLEHFQDLDRRRLWLANTDADSCVSGDWITRQLNLADRGTVGIAGVIRLEENAGEAEHADYQDHYRIEQDGSHSHVHGANLGLRADAYLQAGGWKDVALAEDHCLWQRMRESGMTLCATSTVAVITSARLKGRATGGFADCLRARLEARLLAV